MSNDESKHIPLRPILPRNLTARADYFVAGNPMIARPESGVGNAHPGLEFDTRTLDRHFLPGLTFDFQFGIGAKLVELDPQRLSGEAPISKEDLATGLYLWAVRARFGDEPEQETSVRLIKLDGYMVLRRIMDLELGEVTAIVGVLPASSEMETEVEDVLKKLKSHSEIPPVRRDSDGKVVYACFRGKRANYLTNDGVIDTDLIAPGELTRNLCSPWQWDFADCYCYYWASSKPDLVVGIDGEAQILNFQRDRNAPDPLLASSDPATWMKGNITEPQMIVGWEDLPVVTSDREGVVPRVPEWPLIERPLSLDEIANELPRLAGLEHALCVEYLFAGYSIRAPRRAPSSFRNSLLRQYKAAKEVFSIAVDEMRHFRWVNEALTLLGRNTSLQRAEVIGRDLQRMFQLRPLKPSVLEEFIGIEAPSSVFNDDPQQLDGMYTTILVSLHYIEQSPDGVSVEVIRKVKSLIKTIIDEGENHWERFRAIKQSLSGISPQKYLRITGIARRAESDPEKTLQALCDQYYELLLDALYVTFRLGRESRGRWLGIAHQAMFALDDAAHHLADAGFGPMFALPPWVPKSPPPFIPPAEHRVSTTARPMKDVLGESVIEDMFAGAFAKIDVLDQSRSRRVRKLAEQHRKRLNQIKTKVLEELRAGIDYWR